MLRSTLKFAVISCVVAVAAIFSAPVRAQSDEKEKSPVYTYVAEWAVPRADWPAYEKSNAATKQLMDKLMADGTIVGYGWFKNLVHQEGAPTHGDWWSATSMANLMKALATISGQTGPAADAQAKILAESKHWDFILSSRDYNNHSGTFENVYLRVGYFKEKEGHGETLERALKSYIIPSLEKLLAEGAIHGYSVDREAIHTEDSAGLWIVVLGNGAEGLDKFSAALEAAGKANPTGGPAFASAVAYSAHRDFLSLATAVHK